MSCEYESNNWCFEALLSGAPWTITRKFFLECCSVVERLTVEQRNVESTFETTVCRCCFFILFYRIVHCMLFQGAL